MPTLIQNYQINEPSLSGYIQAVATGAGVGASYYPSNGNPSGYVTTGQTGQFQPTGNYITTSQTGQFYSSNNPSGFITTGQTGQFYSNSNPSGFITGNYAQVWTYVGTSTYSAKAGQNLYLDTQNGGSIVVTLPMSPPDSSVVTLGDLSGPSNGWGWGHVYPITVNTSGGDLIFINGTTTGTVTLNHAYQITNFYYVASQSRWLQRDIFPPLFWTGVLSAGSYTFLPAGQAGDSVLTSRSTVVATHLGTNTTNAGALFVSSLSPGSYLTIKSTNSSDNDSISIMIY